MVAQRTLMCGCSEEEVDMIHCPSCVAHVPMNATSCPSCGEEVCALDADYRPIFTDEDDAS